MEEGTGQDRTLLSSQLVQQAAQRTRPDFVTDLTPWFVKGASETNSNKESTHLMSIVLKEEKWSEF